MTRRRIPRMMGFSSVIVACCFTARFVDGFFVQLVSQQVPPRCARVPTHRHHSMSVESPVSRARLVRELIPAAIFGAVVIGPARPATAALPTAEDYSFGTGSKKPRAGTSNSTSTPPQDATDACPDCSLSKRRKASSTASVPTSPEQVKRPEIKDDLSIPLPKSSVNPNNPVEVVSAISGELDRVQALVNKERWGDALSRLRSYPLTTLKSPTLGMGSVGDVARALGVNNSKASDILEASMEAGLTLREVEDVVFSNTRTLEFFNSADYKQVEDLAKNRQPTDLTEPLQLLSDTKKLVNGVSELMGGGAGTPLS